jgi:hypothetical protein
MRMGCSVLVPELEETSVSEKPFDAINENRRASKRNADRFPERGVSKDIESP